MTKKSYNLKDYTILFNIKEIENELTAMFEEGDLHRQIMNAKYQDQ